MGRPPEGAGRGGRGQNAWGVIRAEGTDAPLLGEAGCTVLSVKGAAERLKVSRAMVYGWVASGRLAHLRLGGVRKRGSIRILEDDLEAFIASCKQGRGKEEDPVERRPPPPKLRHLKL